MNQALQDIRGDFPILAESNLIYFDNAATTQNPARFLTPSRTTTTPKTPILFGDFMASALLLPKHTKGQEKQSEILSAREKPPKSSLPEMLQRP